MEAMKKPSLPDPRPAKVIPVVIIGSILVLITIKAPGFVRQVAPTIKTSPTGCQTDADCVLALDIGKCCDCPNPYLEKQVAKDSDLVVYEPGKDYSPLLPNKCDDVLCSPCPPVIGAVCVDRDCRSRLSDGSTYSPSSNSDAPTSKWTTYLNDDYRFSFQFPPDWQSDGFDSGYPSQVLEGETIKGLVFSSPSWTPNQPEGYQFIVLPEGEFDHGLEGYLQKGTVEIGGKVAERWDTGGEETPGFSSIVFFQNFHDFRIEFLSTKGEEESKTIFGEILSTFNFETVTGRTCPRLEKLGSEELSQVSETECQSCGGRWEMLSKDLSKTGCNPKTSDAGKSCTDSKECVGTCLPDDNQPPSGQCSEYKFSLGCHPELSEGKPLILCRD